MMMKTVVAIDENLRKTADLLTEKGFNIVSLSSAGEADAVVFAGPSDSTGQLSEDIGGNSGVVSIDGGAREPQEVLTLIMNRSGYID